MEKNTGLYLGTEINEKWWRRYMRDGMFARGNGEYWWDDQGFYFIRYLTKKPIFIPFSKAYKTKLGTWHSGRWCMGNFIVKILWQKDDLRLSSGFLISKYKEDAVRLESELQDKITRGRSPRYQANNK